MKNLSLSLLVFLKSTSANQTKLLNLLQLVKDDLEEAFSDKGPQQFRNLADLTNADTPGFPDWNNIHQYGCWCNFETFQKGHGTPVDLFDTHCKALHDNYLCAVEQSTDTCQPDKDDYQVGLTHTIISHAVVLKIMGDHEGAAATMDQIYGFCDQQNSGNDCLAAACKAEARFIFDVQPDISPIWLPPSYEKESTKLEFMHENGFDTGTCDRSQGSVEASCCGKVPAASRYNQHGGRECCQTSGKLFSAINQCCGPEGIANVGDCA